MDLLLDTHTLIWFFNGDEQLSPKAKEAILDHVNYNFVSMASIWEFAIKVSLGKLVFEGKTEGFLDVIEANGFILFPIHKSAVFELEKLPLIHRDPFDRMIIATGISESMHIVTHDENIHQYNVDVIW
jgi:PIN domain nuclease of toxin-antitoxin system